MEMSKCIWIFSFLAVVCLFSNGNALPILADDNDDLYLNDENEPLERREMQSYIFDPESEMNTEEDENIVNLLKRGGFQLSEGYQRYPRIKDRVIIPFYSYGNNKGYYRTRPRLVGSPRIYFGYNPWNLESNQFGNRFISKGPYRY